MNEHELRQLEIPLPFAPQRHPMSDAAQHRAGVWARRHGLLETDTDAARFDALGYGRFAAHWCPTANFSDLVLMAEWITLFFFFDDLQDQAIATGNGGEYDDLRHDATRIIRGRAAAPTDHPVLTALSELCVRTSARNSAAWARRFALDLEIWLLGHARENAFRRAARTPGPDEYPRLRRDACTVLPTVDLAEIIEHTEIPDALYFGPSYQQIIATTADIMCWINDLHSLARELDAEDPINMVTVLRHHRALTLAEAVDEVRHAIDARIRDHQSAITTLTTEMDALHLSAHTRHGILRCVRDCGSAIAGMESWDRTDTVRFAADHSYPVPSKSQPVSGHST
ncbi:terpene synthase family protein [Nocardia huaxiensis]|uniref:Terpene synthase n=1 Tax=Nocardia huaxiensis TaxID=2755382 RepID=A0A7D6V7M5_9NOCA|nr:hypothetical protein [Nocardia huaxiensis]QLY28193.1 hypothetical protein H0264_22675 [Nocardia huaxiensis]UFS98372.1 hypothetical protein LPY97_10960 [Nocardia huaxiensis]